MGTLDVGQPGEGARRLLCPALIARPGSTVDQESTGTGRAGEREQRRLEAIFSSCQGNFWAQVLQGGPASPRF